MDENKIIETYKSNKSLTKTAGILGIGRHKVTNIIKKHGIETENILYMKKLLTCRLN